MRARRVLLALFLMVAPAAWGQVGADWTAPTGGSIRPGYDLNACGSSNSGAIRYNTTVNQFQVCYGAGTWVGLADASGTVAGLSSDRITSGTAGVFVSNTGVINFRTGGITTGYFDASGLLIAPGISITTANGISATKGYFSATSTTLRISQNGSILDYSPNIRTVALFENTSSAGTAIDILSQSTGTGGVFFSKPGGMGTSSLSYDHALSVMKFYLSGGTYGAWSSTGLLIGLNNSTTPANASTTLHVSGTLMTTSWTGINMSAKANAPLEVSGTVSATAFVGDGSGLTGVVAGMGDRIVSGSNQITINSNGIVSITQAGINWAYIHPSLGFVGPGVSFNLGKTINHSPQTVFTYNGQSMNHYGLGWFSDSTDNWSSGGPTAWFASFGGIKFFTSGTPRMVVSPGGYVGIGTTNPNAPLEVAGTVSATAFKGDGSGLTGVGGIPSGAILAFDLASCPSGWSEYVQARGRFLRGIDNGTGNDPDGTRAPGSTQDDALQNITGTFATGHSYGKVSGTGVFSAPVATSSPILTGSVGGGYITQFTFNAASVARTANETRPKNVAVLYCRKN